MPAILLTCEKARGVCIGSEKETLRRSAGTEFSALGVMPATSIHHFKMMQGHAGTCAR